MRATIRMPRGVYNEAIEHLLREHAFAVERVGFMYARVADAGASALLLVTSFEPVPDEEYVPDHGVGARIGGGAIRRAMQRALSTGDSVLHVHLHAHRGPTAFSRVDERELARLVPSFGRVSKNVPHGAVVFSRDHATALVWGHDGHPVRTEAVAVVGFPVTAWRAG
jgi:hypothetical protein